MAKLDDLNKKLVLHARNELFSLGWAEHIQVLDWNGTDYLYLYVSKRPENLNWVRANLDIKGVPSYQLGGKGGAGGRLELKSITGYKNPETSMIRRLVLAEEKAKLSHNIRLAYQAQTHFGEFLREHLTPPDQSGNINPAVTISPSTFNKVFESFSARILQESGLEFAHFQTGLPHQWERYKEAVYFRARDILGFDNWKAKEVGSGKIAKAIVAAIEIKESQTFRNNLLPWEGRWGPERLPHRKILDAANGNGEVRSIEAAFYRLYHEEEVNHGALFEEIASLTGRRYPLLGYLFFLKDWTRYLPIAPTEFERAFDLIGYPLRLSKSCSWENYQAYLARLQSVASALTSFGVTGCRLIDAHSFCWMLVKLPDLKEFTPILPPIYLTGEVAKPPYIKRGDGNNKSVVVTPDDFLKRQKQNNRRGAKAEGVVLDSERRRLHDAGKEDLASKVQSVSTRIDLGYDIESFDTDGGPKRIEVKSVGVSGDVWNFFLSENERKKARTLEGYVVALVDLDSTPIIIWEIPGNKLEQGILKPTSYRVSIKRNTT